MYLLIKISHTLNIHVYEGVTTSKSIWTDLRSCSAVWLHFFGCTVAQCLCIHQSCSVHKSMEHRKPKIVCYIMVAWSNILKQCKSGSTRSLLKWCHFISRLHPLSQNYLYWRSHAGMLQIKYNVLLVQYVNNMSKVVLEIMRKAVCF